MQRRHYYRWNRWKIFSKKYIFNSRFIVRNTIAVVVGTTIIAGGVSGVHCALSSSGSDNGNVVYASQEEEKVYSVSVMEMDKMDPATLDTLSGSLEEEVSFRAAANEKDILSQSASKSEKEKDKAETFVVIADELNLRADPDAESDVLDMLKEGASGEVLGVEGEWTKVSIGGKTGYVKSEFIRKGDEKNAESEEDEKAEEKDQEDKNTVEDEARDAEETETETEAETEETVTEEKTETPTTQAPTTEEVTEAPTEAPTEEKDLSRTEDAVQAEASDLYLLAAIVYAESGAEPYEGQLAVANVVMNRLRSGMYGSTLSDVIYYPYQFSAVYTSTFQNALTSGGSSLSLQAAQEALAGNNNIGGYIGFLPLYNVDTSTLSDYTIIGNHCFFYSIY